MNHVTRGEGLVRIGPAVAAVLGLALTSSSSAQQRPGGNVDRARVMAEAKSGNDWLMNGRDFGEDHYSPLRQITAKNARKLGLAWYVDIDSPMGMSSEPIEVDGVVYVTASFSIVYAIDAASGRVLWKADPHVGLGYGTQNSYAVRVNRGVAVWKGKVYVSTGDCRLIAMDARTGKQLWSSQICDPVQSGSTGAPHIADGKVLIGYNGSDDMIRGSLVAFDAETGKEAWRFWTVPRNPALGQESKALEAVVDTWSGHDWWRFGGGDAWDAITYDPETNLVLFGTAGAGTVEGTTPRSALPGGAKLYSGCVVAVRADTGQYVWHFQASGKIQQTEVYHIIVTDLVLHGVKRHVAIMGPRNGFIYVLDANTGHLIEAKPYGTTYWAKSIDLKTGRPIETDSGKPGAGKTWWPMSYDPITRLVYIPAYDVRDRLQGYSTIDGRLIAWDPAEQAIRWSHEEQFKYNSGVLSTAGNLVFQGQGTGELDAFTANAGRKVWSLQTGSAIESVPITYSIDGRQYVVIPVGWGSATRLFEPASSMATPQSKRGPSRVLAFALGATLPFPYPPDVVPEVPKPPVQTADAAIIKRGEELFDTHLCAGCHSPNADGSGAWVVNGAIPDLRYAPSDVHRLWDAIVLGGSHRAHGMMAFGIDQQYPDVKALTVDDAHAIHAYVIAQAWKAYDEQQSHEKVGSDRTVGETSTVR